MSDPTLAWREIPLEELREWYAEQAAVTSLRALEEQCGVGHSTLGLFIRYEGRRIHPRIRRRLAVWYLQTVSGPPQAVQSALAVLLAGVPDEHAEGARRGLLDAVADVYRSAGVDPPTWTREQA